MNRFYIYVSILAIPAFWGCDLQKEIELELPEYEPQIVVECYLVPGEIITLTLTKSQAYFDPAQIVYVKGADVSIKIGGVKQNLLFTGIPLPKDIEGFNILQPLVGDSVFAYISLNPVPELYDTPIELSVTSPEGDQLFASTIIPKPVPIDTIEWSFNEDSLAYVLTRFQDNPDQPNFYRTVFQQSAINTEPIQNFPVNDEVTNGQEQVFGTRYEFSPGDTIISTIYHITEDYFNFLDINERAFQANLTPFGQPSSAFSNVQGGLGIFTGYTFDRQTRVVNY